MSTRKKLKNVSINKNAPKESSGALEVYGLEMIT